MSQIDVEFCFYDDPKYVKDADRDSYTLQDWHRQLWSKELPSGHRLLWVAEPGAYLNSAGPDGPLRVSSDTIATTHSRYPVVSRLWAELSPEDQRHYERAFYTIGGFIIFPVHGESLNQRRGWDLTIADRFDLTLECIRRHYLGRGDNPLADVLRVDDPYFRLFGVGSQGFANFVEFFHLQDLASPDAVRWLDGDDRRDWNFDRPPLPRTSDAYRLYLDQVADFVAARNARIRDWYGAQLRG